MMRCKTFMGSILCVENQINDWLDRNPQVTVTHMQYCNREPHIHAVVIIYAEDAEVNDDNHI